jgi:hypothetical protein
MAISEKQRQKKLSKKSKKRKISKKIISSVLPSGSKAKAYSDFPIYECLVPDGLFDLGIGSVVVARQLTNGDIAFSSFVLDVYCLGVKDAMFGVVSEETYENSFKKSIIDSHEMQNFEKTHPAYVKSLIEGAVAYAKKYGFIPHSDYANAIKLLATIDSSVCPISYEYGKSGKPFYIQGPHETPEKVNLIMKKLHDKCGEGGYEYLVEIDEDIFNK